jgi:hypothetical protein
VTVEAVLGTVDHADTAFKGSRLVLADGVVLAGVAKVHKVAKLVHIASHSTAVASLEKLRSDHQCEQRLPRWLFRSPQTWCRRARRT